MDVAVVEVGLLGPYDATNVAEAQVAVVTSIGGDHTDFAPGWERAVAGGEGQASSDHGEHAVTLGRVAHELVEVFGAEGSAEAGPRQGVDFDAAEDRLALGGHRMVALRGRAGRTPRCSSRCTAHISSMQRRVAVAAVEAFFDRELSVELVREALVGIEIPGRFEVVAHHPLVVLDGAHNPDALARRHDAGRRVRAGRVAARRGGPGRRP